MMKKILISVIILIPALHVIIGFYGPIITRDVSQDASAWGGYKYQEEYVIQRDIFLRAVVDSGMAKTRLVLAPENSFQGANYARLFSTPNSIDAYQKNPGAITKKDAADVRGIIRAGTRIQMHKLEKHFGYSIFFGYVKEYTPYAKILEGEFSNLVASIEDISIPYDEYGKEDGVYKYKPEPLLISPQR